MINRYFLKVILYYLVIIFFSCTTKKRLADFYNLSNIQEVRYIDSSQDLLITDSLEIRNLIKIFNNAERVPSKFISIETIEFIGEKQSFMFSKNKKCVMINGITFTLNESKINKFFFKFKKG